MRLSSRCLVTITALAACAACTPADDPIKAGSVEAKDITGKAYVYAYPMIVSYRSIDQIALDTASDQYRGPLNHVHSDHRLFTARDRGATLPENDAPLSWLVMDLRAEPLVLCVPDVEKGRYYVVQLIDLYTFNVGFIGTRATGNAAGCFLVAGPGWKGETPVGIKKAFTLETQLGVAIYRTQLVGPSDMPKVQQVQAGYTVQPLSAFMHATAPVAKPLPPYPAYSDSALGTQFVRYLNFLLEFAPVAPEETGMRDRFARIGVVPGAPFDFTKLSEEHLIAVGLGIKSGAAAIEQQRAEVGTVVNGWRTASLHGDRAFFHGDYALRSAAALEGIWGLDASEAIIPATVVDSAGQPLDGSQHRYTLTFPAGELPPVNAFWSVTMYDARTQSFVANDLERYLISSPMLPGLRRNADGSLTLYLQKGSPGRERESNWLPAPDGPFKLVLRLYWPKEEALTDTWHPPGVQPAE